jgi:hypothetical protein
MCVAYQGYLTGEQRYVMKRTYLAYQPWDFVKRVTSSNYTTYDNMDQFGGIKSSMGLVTWDPVGRYIGESGRRWTVSGGLVVPGKLSGNPDQKWGFYD